MNLPSPWASFYINATEQGLKAAAVRRRDGYCLRFSEDNDSKIRDEYGGHRWIQEFSGADEIPSLLAWLQADDEEHPIEWFGEFRGMRTKIAMSKINVDDVAICLYHFKYVDEVISNVTVTESPAVDRLAEDTSEAPFT